MVFCCGNMNFTKNTNFVISVEIVRRTQPDFTNHHFNSTSTPIQSNNYQKTN